MTSSEKILAGILDDARKTADEAIKKAESEAAVITDRARAQSSAEAEKIISEARRRAEIITANGKSAAELLTRDATLVCRRENIEKALEKAVLQLNSLGDGEYFAFLSEILDVSALESADGVMLLSERDLAREHGSLTDALGKHGLTLSDSTAETGGGFILRYGDIEINACFSALIREKREELVDGINKILFR